MTGAASEAAGRAKAVLRRLVRSRIAALTPNDRRAADDAICDLLDGLADGIGAETILGYVALPDEACVDRFLCGALARSRVVMLPAVRDGAIRWGRWRPANRLGRDDERVIAPVEAAGGWPDGTAMLLVPGRAFDDSGERLGRGRGYFDRLLASMPDAVVAVGIAYECQIVDAIPHEPHDRPVAVVVTERGVRRTGATGRDDAQR